MILMDVSTMGARVTTMQDFDASLRALVDGKFRLWISRQGDDKKTGASITLVRVGYQPRGELELAVRFLVDLSPESLAKICM